MTNLITGLKKLFSEILTLYIEKQNLDSEILKELFTNSSRDAFPANKVIITKAVKENFGDYQCNNALPLAKVIKKNPRDIASSLCELLLKHNEYQNYFEKLESAGPGFINITFSEEFLLNTFSVGLKNSFVLPKPISKKVIVDYYPESHD